MCDCSEIEINTGSDGFNGWSPVLALIETTCDEEDIVVHQLISWIGGTSTKPEFDGNIMTDAWLLANPIYLTEDGFTEDVCEATDLKPADGSTGTTGATGATGAQGEDGDPGCDPDITITAQVEGSESYEVTVTQGGTTCSPTYDLEFPIEIFTDNPDLTTAIETAVEEALEVTETSDTSISVGTSTQNIKYTLLTTLSGSPSLAIDNSFANWINYYKSGNQMTVNFRINLVGQGGTGFYRIEMLIPNSETSFSTNYANAISVFNSSIDDTAILSPIITTNSSTGNTHLQLGNIITSYATIQPVFLGTNQLLTFIGQITFLIN